jgi:hypothetical protein
MRTPMLQWLLLAVIAVNVAASPVADPGRPKCLAEGEGCWKGKRTFGDEAALNI